MRTSTILTDIMHGKTYISMYTNMAELYYNQ